MNIRGTKNVRHIDDEYMFGDSILVAPVLTPLEKSKVRELYLPKGVWVDFFTKEEINSTGEWTKKPVDLKTMPLYVKKGSKIKFCDVSPSLINGCKNIRETEF